MDFSDIIYRNNNYVENLHATGNNANKNIIFIQFHTPKKLQLADKQFSFVSLVTFIIYFLFFFNEKALKFIDIR